MACTKNKCKKFIPNLPVSLFCSVFSLWGFLFLLVICIFADSYPVKKGALLAEDFDFKKMRIHTAIASIIYLVMLIGFGVWSVILIIKKVKFGKKVEYY